jgi:hypothetical protein
VFINSAILTLVTPLRFISTLICKAMTRVIAFASSEIPSSSSIVRQYGEVFCLLFILHDFAAPSCKSLFYLRVPALYLAFVRQRELLKKADCTGSGRWGRCTQLCPVIIRSDLIQFLHHLNRPLDVLRLRALVAAAQQEDDRIAALGEYKKPATWAGWFR